MAERSISEYDVALSHARFVDSPVLRPQLTLHPLIANLDMVFQQSMAEPTATYQAHAFPSASGGVEPVWAVVGGYTPHPPTPVDGHVHQKGQCLGERI